MAKQKPTRGLNATNWLTAKGPLGMQACALKRGLSTRRLQLFVVACGDLIWDTMSTAQRRYFQALGRTAEGKETQRDRDGLKTCGPLPKWLGWCIALGKKSELKTAAADLAREVFGNPFRPVAFSPDWRTSTAVALAAQMYESREFSAMPILADALQDAGCDSDDVLNHCRAAGAMHVRGCWVVDLVLGRHE